MVKRAKLATSGVRKAPKPQKRANPNAGVTQLRRELAEALERQKATSEILAVINSSKSELQPVLDTIVRTASRLCDAEFSLIYKLQDGKYHLAATNNTATEFIKYASEHPLSPGRGSLVGRTALEQKTIHLPDCLAVRNTSRWTISAPGNIAPRSASPCNWMRPRSASLR